MMRNKFGTVLLALSFSAQLMATQEGTSTAQFLKIGQSPRAEAMGGAFTAVADDAYAPQFNPAGLAQITRKKLALNHLDFIEDINSQFVSFVLPVNKLAGSLGVSFNYVDLGDIQRRDSTGAAAGGDNDLSSYAGQLTWGQAFGNQVALGASAKFINQDLAGFSESGFAFDVGGLVYAVPNRLAVGVSALNLGPKQKLGSRDEDLPLTFRGGAAYYFIPEEWVLSLDVEKERDTDAVLHGGTEYIYKNQFVIRGGYRDNLEASGGFSAGAGFIWRPGTGFGSGGIFDKNDKFKDDSFEIRIDYGFVDFGDFDETHRVGLQLTF